ncbi:hypothetical protein [Hydrogenophaga sp. BPS33]|uniref:hypothetical protein n=1 Tax=Hydrogenophaga sp. BPS33 TaxID=2651974 RepID=UPI00131FD17C|nr:hypothetical protein [Hydrogenophaga sp. BPS33]QHE87896.1 hypothetical protein F9K07_24870 [Hydrogenophaga sp. BPS33]
MIIAGVSPLQLQTDVSARIQVVEQNKYDELITNARPYGTSQKFTDPITPPDAQLLALLRTLVEQDVLTPELACAKTGVEDAIKERKADIAAKFRKAFRPLLTDSKPSQVTTLLLESAAVASESLSAYEKLNWDFLEEGIADWIGGKVRGTQSSGERVGVDPLYAKGMESLLASLSTGEGRLIRNLLGAQQDDGSKAAVAYLDEVQNSLDMLLWDEKKSPRAVSSASNAENLTAESRQALEATLNLTVKGGQLVQYKAAAIPVTQGTEKRQTPTN